MNKKLLTTLLLCILIFEPICWAEEIIIGADGQARYANQETPMKTTTSGQKYTTTQNPQIIKNTQTQYNYKEGNMDLNNNDKNDNIHKGSRYDDLVEYDRLNYKASCADIDLAQAVKFYYPDKFRYIENNLELMKEYYIFRQQNIKPEEPIYKTNDSKILKSDLNDLDDIVKKNAEILLDNGILPACNIESFKLFFLSELETDETNIQALCSMAKEYNLSQERINQFLEKSNYLALAYNMVKNDSSIQIEDRVVFTYYLLGILSQKQEADNYNQTTSATRRAYDKFSSYENIKSSENRAKAYEYMKYDLRYNGEQMEKILCEMDSVGSDKALVILKENSTYSQKISKMEELQKAKNAKDTCLRTTKNILKIVTLPIWIIPYGIGVVVSMRDWK